MYDGSPETATEAIIDQNNTKEKFSVEEAITMNFIKQSRSQYLMLIFILLIVVYVFSVSCGEKTQKTKVYTVGNLCGLDYCCDIVNSFKEKMTELGYREGENIIYVIQRTNFEPEKEKQILKKFVEDKVDLILTFPTEVSMAAKEATQGTDIPVIFANANIEGNNLVESVQHPGGNVTGVRWPGPDITVKRFEIMLELVPQVKRMWVPYQIGYPTAPIELEGLRPAATAAGVTLVEFPAHGVTDVQAELERRAKLDDIGIDAILLIVEPLGAMPDAFVVMAQFAAEHELPIGGNIMPMVKDYRSLFGVAIDKAHAGRQAAIQADKIFKGTPAAAVPVISSESYVQIDYTAIKEFGLNVSEGFFARADEIIR
jgi:putative ABC transport system substrate-binding protein